MGLITRAISSSNDEYTKAGTRTWAGQVQFGDDSYWGDNIACVRFNNITIPNSATISSAYITFIASGTSAYQYYLKIYGVDEDDTADFSSDPTGRTKTTAAVDWDQNGWSSGTSYNTPSITSIVQEIVDRAGWSSGNDMGFFVQDDGGSSHTVDMYDYQDSGENHAVLTINYSGASASLSPSASPSSSVSPSLSKSLSVSSTPSASPSPLNPFYAMKIAKPGINVLLTQEPYDLVFSSDYGTLKYFTKQAVNIDIDANVDDVAATGSYTHNLNYYPYTEVYVKVWIDDPSLYNYNYCPFFNSGATVEYNATFTITKTAINVYAEIIGMSTSLWNFDFLIFVFKNDLQL